MSESRLQLLTQRMGIALVAVTWFSAATFGLYMLAFYGGSLADGNPELWNNVLPLHSASTPVATLGIGSHFLGGVILLVLGPIQLIAPLRERLPKLHRWVGRVFVLASAVAAVGGLIFIAARGTVGGTVMDLGFGLYGVLMLLCAVQTVRHARARRFAEHRAWGIRLFVLVIASWLYRIEYGFWFMLTDAVGHNDTFNGPFDNFMAFAFYLPNLAVAELFIRARRDSERSQRAQIGAFVVLSVATLLTLIGTYAFVTIYWWPEISARF